MSVSSIPGGQEAWKGDGIALAWGSHMDGHTVHATITVSAHCLSGPVLTLSWGASSVTTGTRDSAQPAAGAQGMNEQAASLSSNSRSIHHLVQWTPEAWGTLQKRGPCCGTEM